LIISVADAPAVRAALVDGAKYGSVELRATADHEYDEEAAGVYAAIESTNLLHHAAECLLRLYLAHAGMPPCPWLEVARLRSPSEFKEAVEKLRGSLGMPQIRC
ncbi:MAG: hypothetical protein M3443_20925, partial [Actinomycetota bacterium]|nr:hypothetical protein [Actinomycetota bacterium]